MKLLLTGAAGNLGRAILRTASADDQIIALDLKQPADAVGSPGNVQWHEGTYANQTLLGKLLPGCDVIMHTAAAHPGNTPLDQRDTYIDLNVKALDMIYRQMLDAGVKRMVYSSSAEVVIGATWRTSGATVISEDMQTYAMDSIYNMTKAMGEIVGRYWHQKEGVQVALMRYMAFAGEPNPKAATELIVRELCPDDVARANWAAARCKTLGVETFHVAPDCPLDVHDVVAGLSDPHAVIEKHFPGAVELLGKNKFGIRKNLFPVLESSRTKQLLGWSPQYNFQTFLNQLDQT